MIEKGTGGKRWPLCCWTERRSAEEALIAARRSHKALGRRALRKGGAV